MSDKQYYEDFIKALIYNTIRGEIKWSFQETDSSFPLAKGVFRYSSEDGLLNSNFAG